MGGNGVISKILSWIMHPLNSEGTPTEWLAGLVLLIIASFLWSTVVRQTVEGL
jgi:hypothetical protein